MKDYLDILAAVFALIAAVFWFLSAYGKLPPMVAYWDRTPDNDPFYVAVRFSANILDAFFCRRPFREVPFLSGYLLRFSLNVLLIPQFF